VCLLLLYSCFVLLHQNLVSHNYFATHNTFSTKTLHSTLFFITKNRFSKPMKKKRPRLKKSPYSSNWTHTYTLPTVLPHYHRRRTHTTQRSTHWSLFFPLSIFNSLLISCFISILQKHRTTTNDPKEYPHKVKTRKTKLFGDRIKTSTHSKYVCSTKIFHYILQMQFDCPHFIEKHTMQIKTNKQQHYKT